MQNSVQDSAATDYTNLTSGQKEFLELALQQGVNPELFGSFIPEIKFKEESVNNGKPTIAYLHTGGTLMMVPSKKDKGALSFDGAIDIPKVLEIANIVSGIGNRINVIGIYIGNIDSKEVSSTNWEAIAATIKTIYQQVDGVVVGHGTHTLEYSSAAVAYALQKLAIPVVFTASQIPILGHPGSDGLPNLTGAMEIAAFSDIAEVVAYANGDIHRGTRVTKANDSRLKIFESKVTGPIGHFTAAGIEILTRIRKKSESSKRDLLFKPKFSTYVTALKMQPGMDHDLVNLICQSRSNLGLVIETYGSGAVPQKMVEVISRHVQNGFPVYLTSSCGESGISSGMQAHDEDAIAAYKAGVRNVGDMSTTAATVKLMHIKGNNPNADLQQIETEMIRTSYAGELTLD